MALFWHRGAFLTSHDVAEVIEVTTTGQSERVHLSLP
jgi:hypothetical protein